LSVEVKFVNVNDLNERSRHINLKVVVVSKGEEKTVISRKDNSEHRVCNFLVGDETGLVNLVLWDDKIDDIEIDSAYELLNAYITIFRNSMQLSLGKYGELKDIEAEITPNQENNISDRIIESPRYDYRGSRQSRFGGRSYQSGRRRKSRY